MTTKSENGFDALFAFNYLFSNNIKKRKNMIENLNIENVETENENDELVFLTPMEVSKIIGCSVQAARELFYREDFPTIKVGKNFKFMKSAFID